MFYLKEQVMGQVSFPALPFKRLEALSQLYRPFATDGHMADFVPWDRLLQKAYCKALQWYLS